MIRQIDPLDQSLKSLTQPKALEFQDQRYQCFIDTYPMSEEQIKAFLKNVQSDASFQEKPRSTSDTNAVVAIAKEARLNISTDDFTKAKFAFQMMG